MHACTLHKTTCIYLSKNTKQNLTSMAYNLDREIRAEFEQFELVGSIITENEFGRGSYAVVLELRYRGLKCAGKKLYRVLYETGIGHAARRYLEECRLLSQTRHPNIVQFLGVCFKEGSQFPILVMEFLPTNLTSCLERYGILPDEISFSILHDVSLGLVYLHCQTPAVIHRDLSANNILLSTNMTAKISDLGVARIVNLTPQQRMTETPGTQAYMPPEVMVADPQYGVSVDEFSFGALMVHIFTAEWPAPKIGPNRIDPANPQKVIAVTEFERREYFIRKIRDHPLLDLIRMCLSNNPDLRPHAPEILGRLRDAVLQQPPSFENRVEMLRRISEDDAHKSNLQQEVEKISIEAQASTEESEKRICTIQQEIVHLRTEFSNTTLAYLVEIEQLKIQAANKEGIVSLREAENSSLLKDTKEEAELLQQQVSAQKAMLSVQETELFEKSAAYERKNAECKSLNPVLTCTRDALNKKEAIITDLNEQLSRTRDYLISTSSPQCLQASLSFSQCAEYAPAALSGGQAVVIKDTLYYTGGETTSTRDKISTSTKIHRYSLHNEKWQTPTKRNNWVYFRLGNVNGTLVVIGGIYSIPQSHVVGDMYYVNTVNQSGESILHFVDSKKPMPTPRLLPAVVSHPSCLIVAGGLTDPRNLTCINVVETYNTKTNSWSQIDRLPIPCGHITGGVHSNGNVYLMGGMSNEVRLNTTFVTSIENLMSNALKKSTDTDIAHESIWSEITNAPTYCPSALIASNMILAIGGATSEDVSNKQWVKTVYAYSISLGSWIRISDLPTQILAACIAPISSTEFLVIGGLRNGSDKYVATVYKGTFEMSL